MYVLHMYIPVDIGKRALKDLETPISKINIACEKLDDDIIPEQFNLDNYLSTVKTHHQKRSNGQDYTLFILDASGSIGRSHFNDMKNAVVTLAKYECNSIVAVMSYSTSVYAESCFNCPQDEDSLESRIRSIPYSESLTATGDAINCACTYVLKSGSDSDSGCGFCSDENVRAGNIDVIIITDGYSNHGRDPCMATSCWGSVAAASVNVVPIHIHRKKSIL